MSPDIVERWGPGAGARARATKRAAVGVGGRHALELYTQVKSVWVNLG